MRLKALYRKVRKGFAKDAKKPRPAAIGLSLGFQKKFDIDKYLGELNQKQIHVLTVKDERYPRLLSRIPDAPFLIYVKGKKGKVDRVSDGSAHADDDSRLCERH